MAKVLNTYRAYSASDINSRTSAVCDHTVVGSTVECTNISLSAVKNVISASTYSLYDICRHANVNRWSGFSPIIRSINSMAIVNTVPTVCKLGDFAGYNHSALTPGWHPGGKAAAETDIWIAPGDNAECIADIDIGEMKVDDLNIYGVALAMYDGVTYMGSDVVDMDTCKDYASLDASISSIGVDTTLTGKIWFINNASTYSDGYRVAAVPNVDDFTVDVKVKPASHLTVYPDSFSVTPTNGNGDGGVGNFNLSAGTCSITGAVDNSNSYTDLNVYAQLLDWLGQQVGSNATIYQGPYTAGQNISSLGGFTGTVQPGGMTNLASYGYWFRIYFEVSA